MGTCGPICSSKGTGKGKTMKIITITTILLTLIPNLAYCDDKAEANRITDEYLARQNYKPEGGFIKDEIVAKKVAEAILRSIYGKEIINRQQPLTAELDGDIWIVRGTLPKDEKGGTADIRIRKSSGEVVFLTHYR